MKKILAVLLTLTAIVTLVGCGEKPQEEVNPSAKSEGSMTFAQYQAAFQGDDETAGDTVTIEGYITVISINKEYGNCNIFLQDGDGAYYVYRMPWTEADDKLVVGQKIIVTGTKAAWAGEVEVGEGTGTYKLAEGTYTFQPVDVTGELESDKLIEKQNMLVSVSGTIADAGEGQAFLYNWDGSGSDGSDLYINLDVNGKVYSFCVESDECGVETEVYSAIKALKVGDKVTVSGPLYWYNAPQLHINNVVVG